MFNITNADFNMEQNKSSKKDEEDEKLKAEQLADQKTKAELINIDYAQKYNVMIRRLYDGNIQDLDLFMEDMSDEDGD